jgi:hypothetical protein
VVALVAVAAIAGCSTIEAFTDLSSALRAEGFTDIEVTVGGGDPVVLVVNADAPSGSTTSEALDDATEIVWTTFPRRFEVLQLTVDGERRRLGYDEIEEDLGARPARLDRTDLTDEVTRLSLGLIVGLVATVILILLVVGVVLLVVSRRRRRRGVMGGPPPAGVAAWAPPVGAAGPGAQHPGWGPPTGWPPTGAGPPPPGWFPPPGWVPPPGWAPPGPPTGPATGPPGSSAGPPTGPAGPPPGPAGWTPTPPAPPLTAEERAEARRDARRRGRPPRGPRPPATQVPPGWG